MNTTTSILERYKTKFNYTPSSFQVNIFDAIENSLDSLAISAVAGSGKTTTIVSALKLIPVGKDAIFLAFNKSIVKELTERVPDYVTVSTLHSYGCRMIMMNFGKVKINENKVFDTGLKLYDRWVVQSDENKYQYVRRVSKLVDFMRFNMIENDLEKIEELADIYNIPIYGKECQHAIELLAVGNKNISEIDFADMIYFPAIKDLKLKKYDYVFVDECQDLNRAQQEMVKKIINKNGRLIAVGDKNQAIYSFAGADAESYERMKSIKSNIRELPLSVSYRLTQELVKHAQEIVPDIQWSETAEIGIPPKEGSINDIDEKSFVLCRNTKPLVQMFIELLRQGKKANIKGREIGKSIITVIEKTKQQTIESLLKHLQVQRVRIKSKLAAKGVVRIDEHPRIVTFDEMYNIIKILAVKFTSTSQLIKYIDTIFLDENIPGITLSTVHKAKGLEADKVFILMPQLMPCVWAVSEREMIQEQNLIYVARTRAKKELIYIRDFEITKKEAKDENDIILQEEIKTFV